LTRWGHKPKEIKQIIDKKANYVLALKANHTLYSQIQQWFETEKAIISEALISANRIEKAHHRTEIREVWTVILRRLVSFINPRFGRDYKT